MRMHLQYILNNLKKQQRNFHIIKIYFGKDILTIYITIFIYKINHSKYK